jgi:putative endonuclease
VTHARLRLGAAGEQRAAAWYESNGYTVVARNWRCNEGEIDLVCTRRRLLVICEVKTRTSDAFGHPAEAVGARKQQKLRRLAQCWLEANEGVLRPSEIRFDVAAVLAGDLDVIEAAF